MTTANDTSPPGVTSMTVFLSVIGIASTIFTYWIGLSPYPAPVLLLLMTVLFVLQRQDDKHFSWKQWALIWGVSALLSSFTAILLLPSDSEDAALESNTASSTLPIPRLKQDQVAVPVTPEPPVPTPKAATSTQRQPSANAPERRIIETSIDELLDDYAKNQIAASRKYGSASIRLDGEVVRVRESLGTGFLILKSTASGQTHEFGFSDRGTERLGSLNPGDRVSIICPTVWEAMSIVMVVECSDVEVR